MTLFEYLMVMVALILGLAVSQILRGLARIARSDRRYTPLTVWAVFMFYIAIQNWWGLWDLNARTDWTQGEYIAVVMLPCLLYCAIELLLPFNVKPQIDWREHYYSVRPWFYGVMCVCFLLASLQSWLLNDTSLLHPYRLSQAAALSIVLAGLIWTSPRLHFWLPWGLLASVGTGNFLFRVLPGAL